MTANRWQNIFSDAFRIGFCDALEEHAFSETDGHPAADLEFLDRFENDVLSGEEHAAFLHHLETCPFCRHEIAVFIQSGILFPDEESDLNADPESWGNAAETLLAAAAPKAAKRDSRSFSSRISSRILIAAALLLFFAGAGILFYTENGPHRELARRNGESAGLSSELPGTVPPENPSKEDDTTESSTGPEGSPLSTSRSASPSSPGMRGTLGPEGGKESEQEMTEHGDADAQISLGIRYYMGNAKGKKADPDYVKAVYWFRQAAEQGVGEAQNWLGLCYAEGKGVDQDFASAAHWFRLAAEQGDPSAQVRLGKLYAEGLGVDQDLAAAAQWFQKAAGQREHEAEYRLGLCYAEGLGVDQDDAAAAEWFEKAANGRNAPAQLQLGLCYAEGRGVEQNNDDAVFWIQKSIDQDSESAKQVLSELEEKGTPLSPEILSQLQE